MSYFVGHPNGAIQEASTTTDTVLVPVTGPEIDKLLARRATAARPRSRVVLKGQPEPDSVHRWQGGALHQRQG